MSLAVPRTRSASPGRGLASIRSVDAELVAVAFVTVLAFLLRVSQLHQSLIGDEVFTYGDIFGHSFGSVLSTVHTGGENSPPLFFLLAWVAAKFGDPTVWIRMPSLVLGTATVPLIYAIGRDTVGRLAGLIGAAIFALTPFAVYYGVEARPYATMVFFVALSTLALMRAVATRSRWWWVLYAGSATAAAYTHYTSIFVLAVQAVWSVWVCRDRLRQPLLANALVGLLYLPWLPHLRGKALAVIGLLHPLSVHFVLNDVLRPIPGHAIAPLRAIPTKFGLVAIGVCALAGLIEITRRWWRSRGGGRPLGPPSRLLLLTALAAATPIGLLLYSLLVTDLWLPRGLSASMPATALVLGALLAGLPRPLTALTAAVVLVTLLAGTIRSFDVAYQRGPFRSMANYLDRVAAPRDPIAIVSVVGSPAIPVQFHKPHLVLETTITLARNLPPGGTAYVVLDLTIARAFKIGTPQEPGLRFVARKHFAGSFPTDLLSYRK